MEYRRYQVGTPYSISNDFSQSRKLWLHDPILSVAIHIEKILKKIVAFLSLLSHTYFTASMKLTFFFFYF